MANLDKSLDDIIKRNDAPRRSGGGGDRRGGGGGGRGGSGDRRVMGRAPGGNRNRNSEGREGRRSTPYARPEASRRGQQDEEMAGNFKVSGTSVPQKTAGAICNTVRETNGAIPGVMATGPAAINQAIKAIAIARKYLLEESPPITLVVQPVFEQDIRNGSNVTLELKRSKAVRREPTEDDLTCKEKTDCYKLAGAIAGRIRDGEQVAVTCKGPIAVLVTVKAIALAQEYTAEEGVDIKFAVKFVDLEDPDAGNRASTYLHFAIVGEGVV